MPPIHRKSRSCLGSTAVPHAGPWAPTPPRPWPRPAQATVALPKPRPRLAPPRPAPAPAPKPGACRLAPAPPHPRTPDPGPALSPRLTPLRPFHAPTLELPSRRAPPRRSRGPHLQGRLCGPRGPASARKRLLAPRFRVGCGCGCGCSAGAEARAAQKPQRRAGRSGGPAGARRGSPARPPGELAATRTPPGAPER